MMRMLILMTIGNDDRGHGVDDDNLDDTCTKIGGGDRGDDKRPKMEMTPRCAGGKTRATWGRTPT